MNDAPHTPVPATDERGRIVRLLLIALGVLGFVVLPGAAPSAGTSSVGARPGAAQTGQVGPASRGRSSRPCPAPRGDCAIVSVAARQLAAGAAVPSADLALPVSAAEVRPPASTVVPRRAERAERTETTPRGLPQGRAPPASTLI